MGSIGGDEAAVLRAEESASGGVDVWSDAVSSHDPDHLLVMVHGILGRFPPPYYPPPSALWLLQGLNPVWLIGWLMRWGWRAAAEMFHRSDVDVVESSPCHCCLCYPGLRMCDFEE